MENNRKDISGSRRRSLRIVSVLLLLLAAISQGQPTAVDLQPFRTEASPGTLEEDILLFKDIVAELARRTNPPSLSDAASEPESIELKISRNPRIAPNNQRGVDLKVSSETRIIINGKRYRRAAESFLFWRRNFELRWISDEKRKRPGGPVSLTPLQILCMDPTLSQRGKTMAMVDFYLRETLPPPPPTPTPNPDFWPVSEVMPLEDLKVSVQFNLRGSKVVILGEGPDHIWIVPYDSEWNPHAWLEEFRQSAHTNGMDAAATHMTEQYYRRVRKVPSGIGKPERTPTAIPTP